MSTSHPRIAVIIVGYKSRDYLEDCLTSLSKSSYAPTATYFLDNGPADGSIDYITTNFPKVIASTSEENIGFAAGNNQLLTAALETDADAFFLLNPDTVVDTECLAELAAAYNPDTILQPLILLHENGTPTQVVNTWGNPLHFLGFSYAGGNRQPAPTGKGKEITLASGAAVLVPRRVFETVGLFDESFFMYHEDVDLSWRARMHGFTIRSLYAAKVWHKYVFSKNSQKFYFAERNRLLFLMKNYQALTLILITPLGLVTELFLLLYAITQQSFVAKLSSWVGAAAMLGSIVKKRRQIQTSRTVSDQRLYPLMSSNLQFSEVSSAPIRLYNVLSRTYWSIIKHL